MIDINKQYRTRDGKDVRIYATDGGDHPVHGAWRNSKNNWICDTWYADGRYINSGNSELDLVEVKPRHKRTVWLNVYKDIAHAIMSKSEAAMCADFGRIACIKIELDFEEGEGL